MGYGQGFLFGGRGPSLELQWEERLLKLLTGKVGGLTPGALTRAMRDYFPGLQRESINQLVKRLVSEGRVIYTLRLGSTRIELGGYQPTRISKRIFLTASPNYNDLPPECVCVQLLAGVAFGAGDHPTTCMMLRALEQAITQIGSSKALAKARALDVGTGNGVLAIAALLLGVGTAVGVDIDPQACHEAGINAVQNEVGGRFSVIAGPVQAVGEKAFDLVLANLRPPTLAALLPSLISLLAGCGWLILSGFRADEQSGMQRLLPEGMRVVWQENDRDWAAMGIRRD